MLDVFLHGGELSVHGLTGNKVVTYLFIYLFFRNAFGLQNHVAFRKSQGG